MKSLLFIARCIPGCDCAGNKRRLMFLLESLSRNCKLFLLPINYDWGDDKAETTARKLGVILVYPKRNNPKHFLEVILAHKIDSVFFESSDLMPDFYKFLPFFGNVIVDTADGVRRSENLDIKTLRARLLRKADTVIVASNKDKQLFQGEIKGAKTIVIPAFRRGKSTREYPLRAGIKIQAAVAALMNHKF